MKMKSKTIVAVVTQWVESCLYLHLSLQVCKDNDDANGRILIE